MPKLILGSQSPRRREILSYFTLPFEVIAPAFDESSIPFRGDPIAYVTALSEGKAAALSAQFPERLILTADTIVYRAGKVYGKPSDEKAAMDMLRGLSGQWHSVYTGVTVWHQGRLHSAAEETKVLFNALTEEQIATYQHKLHLYDKAGSYQLQMAGGVAVRKIDGCYYNVIGFPINTVGHLLKETAGIDLWSYLQ